MRRTKPSCNSRYLEYTLVGRMLLEFNQAIENNQLHIVVALLDDQINVALGSSLESQRINQRPCYSKVIAVIRSNAAQHQRRCVNSA